MRQSMLGLQSSIDTDAINKALSSALMSEAQTAAQRAMRKSMLGLQSSIDTDAINKALGVKLADQTRSAVRLLIEQKGIGNFDPGLVYNLKRAQIARETPAGGVERKQAPDLLEGEVAFSANFRSPGDIFNESEQLITSFDELMDALKVLRRKANKLNLVWRGQSNAQWGLHSSLYRVLLKGRGIEFTGKRPSGTYVFPGESDLVLAERHILKNIAREWRMGGLPALELFAQLQHQGGPTRLLDVSENALVATWFALDDQSKDGRLFAIATTPPLRPDTPPPPPLDERLFGQNEPFWWFESEEESDAYAWGRGSYLRVWRPPLLDRRIAAQDAAFLMEGVPRLDHRMLELMTGGSSKESVADVIAGLSVTARPYGLEKRLRSSEAPMAPIYSFRIKKSAKADIRDALTRVFGFTNARLYPDFQGMSRELMSDEGMADLTAGCRDSC